MYVIPASTGKLNLLNPSCLVKRGKMYSVSLYSSLFQKFQAFASRPPHEPLVVLIYISRNVYE